MILGQSGATAVSHAIEAGTSLQKIDYAKLRDRLLADGQILDFTAPAKDRSKLKEVKALAGIVVDDEAASRFGDWAPSTLLMGIGEGFQHDHAAGNGRASAKFSAKLPAAGVYEVQVAYIPNSNRASNVPVAISTKDGEKQATIDQKKAPAIDGTFVSLGRFEFGEEASVTISNKDTNGHVTIDAVRWLPVSN